MTANPLRQRTFAGIWGAGLISNTGDWFLIIALPLYVFGLTGSALSTSGLFLAELLPALALGSFAGVLADRFNPVTTMVRVNLLQAAVLLPLLLADRQRLWIVFVVAGGEALLETLFTPAEQTLLRRLLESEQLRAGNALIGVNSNVARLVGSPLGGLVIAVGGVRVTMVIDAASYLVSAGLILCARADGTRLPITSDSTGYFGEWLAGLTVVRRSRQLRALVLCAVTAQLAQGMFVVLFVVFVKRSLDGSDADVGLIRGLQAIGAVAGGLCVSVLARRSPTRLSGRMLVGGGLLVFGVLSLATWNGPHVSTAIWVYATAFALLGIPSVAIDAGITTEIQLGAPVETLGRVVAVGNAGSSLAQALGILLAGALADHLSLLLDVQGGIYLGCGLLGLLLLDRGQGGTPQSGAGRQQSSTAAASARPGVPSGVS